MSMKIPMSNSNWSTSRLPQWHKKELSGSHGFQAKQIVSWWYKREGSPGLPAETWWKFTLAILPPSEPSTFWINIWTNILCLMQRLQILLYSLTCHQELNRNPVTLCVCVFKCVCLRREPQLPRPRFTSCFKPSDCAHRSICPWHDTCLKQRVLRWNVKGKQVSTWDLSKSSVWKSHIELEDMMDQNDIYISYCEPNRMSAQSKQNKRTENRCKHRGKLHFPVMMRQ